MSDEEKARAFLLRAKNSTSEVVSINKSFRNEMQPQDAIRLWSSFLSEFRKSIRFFEQSARNICEHAWADGMLSEVKLSAKLNYLFHARNADEHGLSVGHAGVPATLNIGNLISLAGTNSNITIENCREITRMPDGSEIVRRVDGKFSVEDGRLSDGWLNSDVPVSRKKPHLELTSITDRGVVYPPPKIDAAPEQKAQRLAQFAANWTSTKLSTLEKKFERRS